MARARRGSEELGRLMIGAARKNVTDSNQISLSCS
jgi:hypothetical protein